MKDTRHLLDLSVPALLIRRALCSFLLFFSFSCVYAADTNYLDELSEEADSTSNISKEVPLDTKSDMSEMEIKLKVQKPSTYKFYQRLAQNDKKAVFATYNSRAASERERITHIQKKVMDLYFK